MNAETPKSTAPKSTAPKPESLAFESRHIGPSPAGQERMLAATGHASLDELTQAGFEPEGAVMPVVLDTPWAGVIDAVGGVSLGLYDRLSRWKRDAALRRPEESTGFRVVARKRR